MKGSEPRHEKTFPVPDSDVTILFKLNSTEHEI